MKLVYSHFNKQQFQFCDQITDDENRTEKLRLQAYLSVCKKYEREIQAIKQWMPDWEPAFMLKR